MTETITGLQPTALWQMFYNLTQIPRPSRSEERVRDFLANFGRSRGFSTLVDEVGNVIIRKPATVGRGERPTVILQGHMDMVAQANSDSRHDFAKDPIGARVDGDWVSAVGTTLGADNGIGVASILAVLAADDLMHGPIEALFTCNEESGMDGAFGLKPGVLQGKMLINTDAEDEGMICIGCAGGSNVNSKLNYDKESNAMAWPVYRIGITGLRGGHSGVDIHRGRGNAVTLLFRLLKGALFDLNAKIGPIAAGSLRNAIPREAFATVAVDLSGVTALKEHIDRLQVIFSGELRQADPNVRVSLELIPIDLDDWLDDATARRLVHTICACPTGVLRMSDDMPGLVESSNNLAIVRARNGEIEIYNLVRSSVDTARSDICGRLESLFALAGARTDFDGQYPGWPPNLSSPLLQLVRRIYREHFGRDAEIGAIHAGLECGILGIAYPDIEMISFGPTIRFPHSPDERVNIPSVARYWELLLGVLAEV